MRYGKIYGLLRTGTTYVQYLLECNFDTTVFSYILGLKHGNPTRFCRWINTELASPNRTMTHEGQRELGQHKRNMLARFETVAQYLDFLRELRQHLGGLYYVIVIKDPYAVLASMRRYWRSRGNLDALEQPGAHRAWMQRFNRRYEAWRNFHLNHVRDSMVVRYESVLGDYEQFLVQVQRKFRLQPLGEFVPFPGNIHLDPGNRHMRRIPVMSVEDRSFARQDYYNKRQYIEELGPALVKLVTKTVDWKLMKKYGYEPEAKCASR